MIGSLYPCRGRHRLKIMKVLSGKTPLNMRGLRVLCRERECMSRVDIYLLRSW